MPLRNSALKVVRRTHALRPWHGQRRRLVTLAIESSCDDTSIAILEKQNTPAGPTARLHFHDKVTSDNRTCRGVHPLIALEGHQASLALLLQKALPSLPVARDDSAQSPIYVDGTRRRLDFVAVTRGPGMRNNLSVGLDAAKGVAVAWQRPLVGVNHMQAHALTPRLVRTLAGAAASGEDAASVDFPFLSLLVSGGHTMLIHSTALATHPTLATTMDIAAGDALDKIARDVVPADVLAAAASTMYGPVLEAFAFPSGAHDYAYTAPSKAEETQPHPTPYGWALRLPYTQSPLGVRAHAGAFSFSGIGSQVKMIAAQRADMEGAERVALAREAQRAVFEHMASRVVLGLAELGERDARRVRTLVVSGGVAANSFLKHVLRTYLDAKGYPHINLVFPPLALCTDNAAMIAWAGMEMYEAGWQSALSCRPLRKWSLDPAAEDGGIFGVGGWEKR